MRWVRWLPTTVAAAVVALSPTKAGAVGKQPTALGTGGAAASVDPLATAAAIDVLAKGGNAFDAAIAAAGVLGVVEPYSCGIGGGGFMTFRDAKSGKILTLDSREKAPAAMQPNSFFINGAGPTDAQFNINRYSGLSVGVPGTPYAWSYILRHYGTYSLAKALKYGETVATNGFVVDKTFYDQTYPNDAWFDDIPSTAAIYLDPDGTPREVGTKLRNPDLAKTYALLGKEGVRKTFYTGALAQAIVNASQTVPVAPTADHTWRPGLMTMQDLLRYKAALRDPVKLTYMGADVYGMGPPSSGGPTVLEALNIMQQDKASHNRAITLYDYLEASRLAYADRNAFLGDPSFVANPIAGLLDPGYGASQFARIPATAPSGAVSNGTPPQNAAPAGSAASVDRVGSTTHLSVADS